MKSFHTALATLATAALFVPLVHAQTWDNGGDGVRWADELNWSPDGVPITTADVTFSSVLPSGTVQLDVARVANSITFNQNTTLGSSGTFLGLSFADSPGHDIVLTGGSQNMIHAPVTGAYATNGLTIGSTGGGGSLYLSSFFSQFTGPLTIDGAGTSLLFQPGLVATQVNNPFGISTTFRGDTPSIGPGARTINLTNGGEVKIIGTNWNPDASTKVFSPGAGGGAFNVAAGHQYVQIDDAGQVTAGVLTKNGTGRLALNAAYGLTGLTVNAGVFDFTNAGAIAAGSTVTVNGGLFTFNGGGTSLNLNTTLNGGALGVQGGDHGFGSTTNNVDVTTTLALNGGVLLSRDAFNPQQARFMRINSDLTGSGTIDIYGATSNGQNSRIIFQNGESSTENSFNGTLRLQNNTVLESNPRSGKTQNIGNTLGNATVELAGFNSGLDIRDNGLGNNSVLNAGESTYTGNSFVVSSTQVGGVQTLATSNAGANTGNTFLFNALTIGNQRLRFTGNNTYDAAFNNLNLQGSPVFEIINTGATELSFLGTTNETAANQTITKTRNGNLVLAGATNVSGVRVDSGILTLAGANGAVNPGSFSGTGALTINGGSVASVPSGSTAGLLLLDNNASYSGVAAANNTNRVGNAVTVNLLSNGTIRLNSVNNGTSSETFGTLNITGHGTLDVTKNGTANAPVALTINSLAMGTNAGATFSANTGTVLGGTGANSARVILSGQADTGFLGAAFTTVNATGNLEFAQYSNTIDTGAALGVSAITSYTLDPLPAGYTTGLNVKKTTNASLSLGASSAIHSLNLNLSTGMAANTDTLTVGSGNTLTIESGGIISTGANTTYIDRYAATKGSITSGNSSLVFHVGNLTTNNTMQVGSIITNNAGAVALVKNGVGTLSLTNTTSANTFSGGVTVNNGILDVWRSGALGGNTVTLNGGMLQLNVPNGGVNNGVIAGFGNNVILNGNATIGLDNNGETGGSGTNNILQLGNLTANGNHILSMGGHDQFDLGFAGATLNGRTTFHLGLSGRDTNSQIVMGGNISGSGFDVALHTGTATSMMLGSGATDNTANTYDGTITIFGATLRLHKANNTNAITNGAAADDVVINGGNLNWGPGHVGDVNATNNNISDGLVPLSPAGTLAAGQNNIADTATITLLSGNLGQSDRINNEKWGTLNQRNGQLNVGLGTMEVDVANISGGAFSLSNGGALKAGTLNLLSGAYNPTITTGLPGDPSRPSILEIGSGGLNTSTQGINLGSGSSGNFAGAGAILRLGGNLTAAPDAHNASSYNQGIYIQYGNSFRELGNSHIDLMGANRTFTIDPDIQFFVTPAITNGGLVKNGGGTLVLQPSRASTFTGAITVNEGVLASRGKNAFGTSAGGVTVADGGTVKLESGWTQDDSFTLSGPGAIIAGSGYIRESGALVSVSGINQINGNVTINGGATIAAETSEVGVTHVTGQFFPQAPSLLDIASSGGVTGTGLLTFTGNGDILVRNGVNTSGGLVKHGAGILTLAGPGTFAGATEIQAGILHATASNALGTSAGGTTVFGGATLRLSNNANLGAEPMTLTGNGALGLMGAIHNLSGNNSTSGNVTLQGNALIRSDAGTLTLSGANLAAGSVSTNPNLAITGQGHVVIANHIATGSGTLTKTGSGNLTLSGSNTFTGSTTAGGGTIILGSASALSDSAPLILSGGKVAATTGTETVGGLTLNGGGGTLISQGGNFMIGAITPNTGGSLIADITAGSITTTTPNVNGILGGYAVTVNGANADFAVGGGPVASLLYTAADDLNEQTITPTTPLATSNNQISVGQAKFAPFSSNSIKIAGTSGGIALSNGATISSGAILFDNDTGISGVSGTGTLAGLTANNDLFVHAQGGIVDISTALIGAGTGSLIKDGDGSLILRGTSSFTGDVFVNGGSLGIVSTGAHPTALGAQTGQRNIRLNGGTFSLLNGNYDLNVSGGAQMQFVIESGGGTFNINGGQLLMNDVGQFLGNGDLTISGGGRLTLTSDYSAFKGNIVVAQGILEVGNILGAGNGSGQTITVRSGSSLVHNAGGSLTTQPELAHDLILQNGSGIYAQGATRGSSGDIQMAGTVTIGLLDVLGNFDQQRSLSLEGRLTGQNVTLDVFAPDAGAVFYLTSGSNDITGTINLNPNSRLEARLPGSLGGTTGGLSINMDTNTSLLLRHHQSGDFRTNLIVNGNAILDAQGIANIGGSNFQQLSINDLTVNNDATLTVSGGGNYHMVVDGAANFTGRATINSPSAHLLLENGLTSGGDLVKLASGGWVQSFGAMDVTGDAIINGSNAQPGILLRGANGTLTATGNIELRGGELRLDNGDAINTSRLSATGLHLNGGTLRVTGTQTLPTVSATGGITSIIYSMASETVPVGLSLTGFTRQTGSSLYFTSDFGTLGVPSSGQVRVQPRVLIPGQANTSFLGAWALINIDEWAGYNTTLDNGVAIGVTESDRNGLAYTNPVQTSWSGTVNLNTGSGHTLTANRILNTVRYDSGSAQTIALGTNNLTINAGGIISRGGGAHLISGTGNLTTGAGQQELHIWATGSSLTIDAAVIDNGNPLALIKAGGNTLVLTNTTNSYSGGTHVNQGALNANGVGTLGTAANNLTLAGGTLNLRSTTASTTAAWGHNVSTTADSILSLDLTGAGVASTVHNLGNLTIQNSALTINTANTHSARFTGLTTDGFATLNIAPTTTVAGAFSSTAATDVFVKSGGGTLVLGGGAGDAVANTFAGQFRVEGGTVQLNKAPGTNALAVDITNNNGAVTWLASNQVADSRKIVSYSNAGNSINLNGFSETVASVELRGGFLATGIGTLTTTGDLIMESAGGGIDINSNGGRINVGGDLKLQEFTRSIVLGASNATLDVTGKIIMQGTTITSNSGNGNNTIIMRGGAETLPSALPANLGNSNDSDTFISLNGTQTFDVADGAASFDLIVSNTLRDNGAALGGITKTGPGIMVIQGTGTNNSFTGPTSVNEGVLELAKNAGQTALSSTVITIGDGVGGTNADILRLRNLSQINTSAVVTIASSGLLDLQYGNAQQSLNGIIGSGNIHLGPGSVLQVNNAVAATTNVFSGGIRGLGFHNGLDDVSSSAISKYGAHTWNLTGYSDYAGSTFVFGGELRVGDLTTNGHITNTGPTATGVIRGSRINVNNGSTLSGTGLVEDVVVNPGGVFGPGNATSALANVGSANEVATMSVYGDVTIKSGGNVKLQIFDALGYITNGVAMSADEIRDAVSGLSSPSGAGSTATLGALAGSANNEDPGDPALLGLHDSLEIGQKFVIEAGGTITIVMDPTMIKRKGMFFDLFDSLDFTHPGADFTGADRFKNGFDDELSWLNLPDLTGGTGGWSYWNWDMSLFNPSGGVIILVPEPSRFLLIIGGLAALALRRKRDNT